MGEFKDANLTVAKIISEVVFDNAKMKPKVKIEEAVFSCNLYEIVLENLQAIDGIASYSTVDGTPVNVTSEAKGTGWTVGSPIALSHKNGDNTIATSVVVKNNGTNLTANTDYRLFLENGITKILPITSQTGAITVAYTYTPSASKEQLYRDVVQSLAVNRFKFVNTDEYGKEFGIEFFEGYNRAGIEATFQPDETTDDALSLPIEIKSFPVSGSQNLFRIYDEQDSE